MKHSKRMIAAVAALSLTASLTACGGNQASGNQGNSQQANQSNLSPAEQIAAAQEKMNTVKSLELSMNTSIDMKVTAQGQEQKIAYHVDLDMDVFNEPLKMKGDMTIDMGEMGGKQEMELYLEQAQDNMNVYMEVGDAWTKQTLTADEVGLYDPKSSLELYLESSDSFTQAGNEKVGDVDATKFTGVIKGDKMIEILEENGMMETLNQFGASNMSEEELQALLESMGGFQMAVWIDSNGYPVQYEMDLSQTIKGIMDQAMEELVAQGVTIDVTNAKVNITCSDFDKVEDFEIPQDALKAA